MDDLRAVIGVLTLEIDLPGCMSLKEKRSRLKPLVARLHREFNVSAAEVSRMDNWQQAILACTMVANEAGHVQRSLEEIVSFIETRWPDVTLIDDRIQIL
jgi:uncharacterized protein YlxP (DUF503 family)